MRHANVDKIIHLYLVWHKTKKQQKKQQQQNNNGINWSWWDAHKEIARIKKKKLSLYACRVRLAPQATLFCAQYDFATETLDGFISLVMRVSAFSHFRIYRNCVLDLRFGYLWIQYAFLSSICASASHYSLCFPHLSEEIEASVDIWNDHSHWERHVWMANAKRTGKI